MTTSSAILTDTTLCTGCQKCVAACKSENELGKDLPRRWKRRIDDLSSTRYTTILRRPNDHFVRQQCRHCLEPACVSACLVGALQKTPEGPVIYDGNRCMGCRYCMVACPYGIPRYDWDKPIPYIRKCDMCHERVKDGGEPACVEACPEKATIFGDRDELIEEARRRIRENPEKYVDKIYGETEIGGTAVIYISDIPLDFLAFKPELGDEPLPELTWAALSKVPPLALGVGGVMAGVWWIIGRRIQLTEEAKRSAMAGDETDQETPGPSRLPEKNQEK
jgi:formate dehydrogenase iron-sulfur subunit